MAAEYLTIKHKNKSGEVKEITYRVDADFKPTRLDEICEEFIQNYCLANRKDAWLDKQYEAKEEFVVKASSRKINGKEYKKGEKYIADKSFISIRKDFGKEFFGIEKKDEVKLSGRMKWAEKKKKANIK